MMIQSINTKSIANNRISPVNNSKGFTIIEVLIVLAIAGLILLIVFLAVPALQRNQRNSARRGDAARIASSAITFVANNNGVVPGGATYLAATATTNAGTILGDAGKLGQYTLTAASPIGTPASSKLSVTTGTQVAIPTAVLDSVNIAVATICDTGGATTTTGATARSIAIQYTLETSSATVSAPACQNAQ